LHLEIISVVSGSQ